MKKNLTSLLMCLTLVILYGCTSGGGGGTCTVHVGRKKAAVYQNEQGQQVQVTGDPDTGNVEVPCGVTVTPIQD